MTYPWTTLVSLAAVLVCFGLTAVVGRLRARHKVAAPSMDGPEEFKRAARAHANTIEQIVLFMPVLWLFAMFWGDGWAALIGIFWPIGRALYAQSYLRDPKGRGPGFLLTLAPTAVLFVGALIGAVLALTR
jgi:glutathione S-transferase